MTDVEVNDRSAPMCRAWFMGERCGMRDGHAGAHGSLTGNRWDMLCRDCSSHKPGECPEGWPEGRP